MSQYCKLQELFRNQILRVFFSKVTAPWHRYGKNFNDLISQIKEEDETQLNLGAVAKNKLDKETASSE
jgi:hypothetical protein